MMKRMIVMISWICEYKKNWNSQFLICSCLPIVIRQRRPKFWLDFWIPISLKRWTDFRGACLSSSLPPCRPVYSPVVPFPEFSGRLLGKTAKQAPLLFCIAPNTTINTAAHSVYRTLKFIDFIDFSVRNSYWPGAAVTKNRSIWSLMDFSGRFCDTVPQNSTRRRDTTTSVVICDIHKMKIKVFS